MMRILTEFLKEIQTLNLSEINAVEKFERLAQEDPAKFLMDSLISTLEIITRTTLNNLSPALSIHKKFDVYPLNDHASMERGLEIARTVYAHYAAKAEGASNEFLYDGVVVLEDFFDPNAHEEILQSIDNFPLRVNKSPENLVINHKIGKHFLSTQFTSTIKSIIGEHYIGPALTENTFVQRLNKNSQAHLLEADGTDSQYRIHYDIFAPSTKWWYFPESVSVENGPLMYARNSCGLNKLLLTWVYNETLKITNKPEEIPDWKQPSHSEGSLRISEEELNQIGYAMTPAEVRSNTLVVANVHGFHRRGKPHDEQTNVRSSVHSSIRTKPF
jgi:hypothetical protein